MIVGIVEESTFELKSESELVRRKRTPGRQVGGKQTFGMQRKRMRKGSI